MLTFPVTDDCCFRGDRLGQGSDRARLLIPAEANDRVDQRNAENHPRLDPPAESSNHTQPAKCTVEAD